MRCYTPAYAYKQEASKQSTELMERKLELEMKTLETEIRKKELPKAEIKFLL